jgi:hypothetical protein
LHRRAIHKDQLILLAKTRELVLQDASGGQLRAIKRHVTRQVKPLGNRGLRVSVYQEHTPA